MHLIDADALKQNFLSESDKFNCNRWDISAILDEIQDAPTITAKSLEKHGKWEKSDIPCENFKCSVCGGGAWYYDYRGDISKSRFCPNCGAKMDMKS